ncbi:SMI1/KNR4 family protein [Streptomyces sp. MS06]|uniref:SMI1/KNR4 family protein n=1 Tax=Streptomyces sp. MS06 TaxID=3385974 RepID=UPI0039A29AD7
MVSAFDVAAALRGGAVDRRRVWDFVRDFAAAWSAPLDDASGTAEEELAGAEAALGLRLPAALREGYALLGTARRDLTGNQDPLRPPAMLQVSEECGGVLVFRTENQGCADWGVRLGDLDQDDPPVFVRSGDRWLPFLERVSLAWVELVLSETLLGQGPFRDARALPTELIRSLPERFARVELPDHPMWTGGEQSPARWFSAPGKLLRLEGQGDGSWLHVRGRTAADLAAIHTALPGSWRIGPSAPPRPGTAGRAPAADEPGGVRPGAEADGTTVRRSNRRRHTPR